jgi:hypothetical protein
VTEKLVADAPPAAQRISHHSYLGTYVDAEVIHRQARDRMSNRLEADQEDTVVHHHGSNIRCRGREHTVYTHADQKISDKVFVEDGYTMWGIADPKKKR